MCVLLCAFAAIKGQTVWKMQKTALLFPDMPSSRLALYAQDTLYEYDLNLQERYAEMVRTLKVHYGVWAATCFVEEGDAAERAHARAVPGQ